VKKTDDGWDEVPAGHELIVRARFENKVIRLRGTKRVRVQLQLPNISGTSPASPFSLSIGFHKI
jgi:hypothetical protein